MLSGGGWDRSAKAAGVVLCVEDVFHEIGCARAELGVDVGIATHGTDVLTVQAAAVRYGGQAVDKGLVVPAVLVHPVGRPGSGGYWCWSTGRRWCL